jgi:hypothetical protein
MYYLLKISRLVRYVSTNVYCGCLIAQYSANFGRQKNVGSLDGYLSQHRIPAADVLGQKNIQNDKWRPFCTTAPARLSWDVSSRCPCPGPLAGELKTLLFDLSF